jgi:hypothetical protein
MSAPAISGEIPAEVLPAVMPARATAALTST